MGFSVAFGGILGDHRRKECETLFRFFMFFVFFFFRITFLAIGGLATVDRLPGPTPLGLWIEVFNVGGWLTNGCWC